jgi:hypothetical protein
VKLRTTQRSKKSAQIRSCHRSSQSSCTAAWPCCEACLDNFVWEDTRKYRAVHADERKVCGRLAQAAPHATQPLPTKPVPKMKDPSGGTTGRVKPYGALGVDGRSRRIQPMGRDNRSHIDKSQHPRRTFKTPDDFFNVVFGAIGAKTAAQQAISRRLRPICPTLSTAGSHSAPGSRKRYRRTGQAPAFFLPQACRKPRQVEPPAWRSPR